MQPLFSRIQEVTEDCWVSWAWATHSIAVACLDCSRTILYSHSLPSPLLSWRHIELLFAPFYYKSVLCPQHSVHRHCKSMLSFWWFHLVAEETCWALDIVKVCLILGITQSCRRKVLTTQHSIPRHSKNIIIFDDFTLSQRRHAELSTLCFLPLRMHVELSVTPSGGINVLTPQYSVLRHCKTMLRFW